MKNISFKLIFRSWQRNKTFTVISILSLAVGIACTNLLAAFIIHEYNVEADNPNKDRMVVLKLSTDEGMTTFDYTRPDMATQVLEHIPELDMACKVYNYGNVMYCKVGENMFNKFEVVESDSVFFQFFPQKVIKGSLEDALIGPDRVVLTESFSKRIFGRSDPIGQTVQIQFGTLPWSGDEEKFLSFTVSAVVKDNTQAAFSFDVLFIGEPTGGLNFFLLKDHVSIPDVQAKIEGLVYRDMIKYSLLSIQDACFFPVITPSHLKKPNTDLLWIALFSAILILVIACFNYINLSFSRVFKQLYSLHIQKLMGAEGRQLSMQLFADTFMTVSLGFLIAQLIQFDLLGIMNRIMSVQVSVSFLYSSQMLPVTSGFILLLACIPALYMSRRLPEMSISVYSSFYRGKARRRIIASLAILQFVISFILIIGTFTARQQISLLYDKVENYKDVYTFTVGDYKTSMLPLQAHVSHLLGIQAATLSTYAYEDCPLSDIKDGIYDFYTLEDGGEEIMEVMGYKLIRGLPLKEALVQYPNPVYLNRTWAQSLFPDGDLPLGKLIKEWVPRLTEEHPPFGNNHVIAGVVEDYFKLNTTNSLETPIGKNMISYTREGFNLKVRLDPNHTSETIKQIYAEWNKLYPGQYLEHESMYNTVLSNNKKLFELSDLLMMYSIISILLICFGLFGMALYAIEQRTKEVGIRKVNGSTTPQIMLLLNRRFIIWIGIAYLIALPVVWLLISQWMQSFAYRAGFSIWTYILSLLIVVIITLLTVSWQSFKAASGNPVDALRDE